MKPLSAPLFRISLVLLCMMPLALYSQGILITAGGKIEATGNASIEITNGNYTNQGTFSKGTSTLIFSGNAVQQITSGNMPFYNVTTNNTGSAMQDLILQDSMKIIGALTMNQGVIGFSANTGLLCEATASSNGGSAQSFVNGPVTKRGSTAFTFPTGSIVNSRHLWAPIGIAAPASSSRITATYHYDSLTYIDKTENRCNPAQIDHVSGTEYWILNTDNAHPDLTLHWKDGLSSGITDPNNLLVALWTGACWESMSATGVTGSSSTGFMTSLVPFSYYGPVTYGSKDITNPLPVGLLTFNAQCGKDGVELTWTTASEINNNYFTLERSTDTENWNVVGTVNSAGNTNSLMEYYYHDDLNTADPVYYRLKQTDADGHKTTFDHIQLECENTAATVHAYPNPFQNEIFVEFSNTSAADVEVEIRDITGRLVLSKSLRTKEPDDQKIQLDGSALENGIYTIVIRDGEELHQSRIVKNK